MADPKYASLPGIVSDQPDVFETSELPEADQDQRTAEDFESEEIEGGSIDANIAFKRFNGKSIGADKTDFSDKVKRSRHAGYSAWSQSEYEMLEDGAKMETVLQRYQRLQHEIKELDGQVKQVKEDAVSEKAHEGQSPVQLFKLVESLQQQMTDLQVADIISPNAQLNISDPQGSLQKRLLNELDSFKASHVTSSGKGEKQKPSSSAGDKVAYELYYKPEQATFTKNQRVADIEQRIQRLESVIGQDPEKLSSLTKELTNKSLLGAVEELTSRTHLLDNEHLDMVEGRLQIAHMKLSQITEKTVAIGDSKTAKISELYELVKKWDDIATTLPHVVDRMESLKSLHEQALQFSTALSHLDNVQQQLNSHLHCHTDMLKQLETKFQDNMSTIKANCENIDKRLKTIKK